jgi:hypothetical protein
MTTKTMDRRAACNSRYKKLAVRWFNEVQFSNETLVVADSLVLRNGQLVNQQNVTGNPICPCNFELMSFEQVIFEQDRQEHTFQPIVLFPAAFGRLTKSNFRALTSLKIHPRPSVSS